MTIAFPRWTLALGLAVLAVTRPTVAQEPTATIIGRVIDSTTLNPLAGVGVTLLELQRRTTTGQDGAFILRDVPAGSYRLRLTRIGYGPLEHPITLAGGETATIELTLAPQAAMLQAVVVTGYGEQEARDVTGAVQRVGSETFNQGPIVSPDQLLAGKVPGVQITTNTGEPGGQTYIRIRGGTSINASNDPLFVIDGVPVDNVPHNPGAFSAGRNPLNFINPNDIESITVLRDASAAAIYGSRGANGVILITTKGATDRSGGSHVSYETWASVARATADVPVLSAAEFMQAVLDRAPGRDTLLSTAATDWQGLIQRDGIGRNHAFSFSGGSENASYRGALGYLDQDGIIHASGTKRTSLTFNYTHRMLDDQLQVRANLKAAQTSDRFAPGGTVSNAVSFAPTQPVQDAASTWAGYWEWGHDLGTKNPVAENTLMTDVGKSLRGIGNLDLQYLIAALPGLSARVNLGFDRATGERVRFAPNNLRAQSTTNGEIREAQFTRDNTLLDAYLHFERALPDITSRIDVTGGYSYQNWDNRYPEFRAWDLSSNLLGPGSTAPANEHSTFVREEANRLISFFGRVNYALKDKYLATVTLRRDGSSRFGLTNRWGNFPSAAVAWRIGAEDFARGLPMFTDLKLRLGYGVTGNQEIGDFRYLRTFTFGDNTAQYQFGNEFVGTLRPNGVDPNLKWEETKSTNVGLEYALFDGRWSGSLDFYHKRTDDLLVEVTVPAGANLTNIILTNIGSVQNRGFEFAISGPMFARPALTWNIGFNFSTNANKVLKLTNFSDSTFQGYPVGGISGGVGNTVQILREGYPINSFYVFQHLRGADGRPLVDGADHNGDGSINRADIYADVNGDGAVNDLDRRPYRSPNPKFMLGLTSSLQIKQVDVSFTLRGHIGNYVYNNVASNYGNYSRVISDIVPSNMHRSVLETGFIEPQLFSDYYVEDASFLRMDNITVGFRFGDVSRLVRNFRVYGTIQNAFTITGYSGLDPEIGNISGANGIPRVGIDDNVYPRARTYLFGLSFDK